MSSTGHLTHGKLTAYCNVGKILLTPLKLLKGMLCLSSFAPVSPVVMENIVVFLPSIINTIAFLFHVIRKKWGQSKTARQMSLLIMFPMCHYSCS